MTVVFVHGVPETSVVWDPLIAELDRDDVVRLSPPGFGAPVPAGFGATMQDYQDWLVGELTELAGAGAPLDLVGHDWGGGHVLNVAMARPDLLRSWCSDVAGVFAPDYVWHDLAQTWQEPGVGELAIDEMVATGFAERAVGLIGLGMAPEVADELVPGLDADMGRCILALYRSAAQPVLAERGRGLPAAAGRPGLALNATADPFVGTAAMHKWAAELAGAQVVELPDLGHWWMTQDPERGAAVLNRFWASLPT